MAVPVTDVITTSSLPDALRVIYSNELEFTARPAMVYDQFCEVKDDFRVKKGQQAYWTIFRQLPPAINPLVQNQDVDGGSVVDFQRSLTVDEYGYSIGTTEELDLTSYFGPIGDIVRSLLAPQMALTLDLLARNAFLDRSKAKYETFAGTASSFDTLGASDVMSSNLIRQAAYKLSVRRAPLMGSDYVAIAHPAVIYDLRGDSYWRDAQLYAGAENIFNGEEGRLHGVRFIKSDMARIPNAGAMVAETALSSAAAPGQTQIQVASVAGFAPGMEVSILSSTSPGAVRSATDGGAEEAVIDSIAGSTITLKTGLLLPHGTNSRVVEAADIYPVSVFGGTPAVGKGVVLPPEVRVALPTDKLRRLNYVGWYALLGYGVLREWVLENIWCRATQASAPAFPW
jgi:N4-gp56 family major capsid protein